MITQKKHFAALAFSFCYGILGVAPVMAADTEIYSATVPEAQQEAPSVMLLIDTSGSMAYDMYSTSTKASEENKRYTHLREAARRLLSTLPGDIKVGLSRYNEDSVGGRIVYPARRLDAPDSANPDGTVDFKVSVKASAEDATQYAATSAPVSNEASLFVGGTTTTTYYAANSDAIMQCANGTNFVRQNNNNNRGLFLGHYPNQTTNNAYCSGALGLRFPKSAFTGVAANDIVSARIVFTKMDGNGFASGGWWGGTQDQYRRVSLTTHLLTAGSESTFSTNDPVAGNSRTYSTLAPTQSSVIEQGEFEDEDSEFPINVTELVKYHLQSGLGADHVAIFKIVGNDAAVTNSNDLRIRRVYGLYDSATLAPRLEIVRKDSNVVAGVRFKDIAVPMGATINSAYIELTPDRATDAAVINIYTDKNDSVYIPSPAFSSIDHLGSSAGRWSNTSPPPVQWTTGAWQRNTPVQADITALVQSKVNAADYCGGGDASWAFKFVLSSGSAKTFASYDSNPGSGARLVVNYTPPTGNSCVQLTRVFSVGANKDDGHQDGNTQALDDTYAVPTTSRVAGFRFNNVSIPQGAEIIDAKLSLHASNTPNSSNRSAFTIKGLDVDNLVAFSSSYKMNSYDKTTASVSWTPSAWSQNTKYTSPSIASIIQEVVDRSGWVSGASLGLVITSNKTSTSNASRITTREGNASRAALLEVSYRSTNVRDAQPTVRNALINAIDSMNFNGGTPLNESYYESALYMMGQNGRYGLPSKYAETAPAFAANRTTYASPLGRAECQANALIALTDGEPTSDDDRVSLGGNCSNAFDCMAKTASYMFETGKDAVKVRTYTIGFGPGAQNAFTSLEDVATKGGGTFFNATDVDSLTSAFQTIFASLVDANGSMATPGVAVNQLNRSEHLNQVYYGVFKPGLAKRWQGNLKRYKLNVSSTGESTVLDADDRPALGETGFFSNEARSFWSPTVDGNEAARGGAVSKLAWPRKVLFGSTMTRVVDDNRNVAQSLRDAGYNDADMRWIAGIDVDDADGDGETTDIRADMGAPLHSQPVLVPYANDEYVAYFSTNDGLLHAVNTETGAENWAWIPDALLEQAPELRSNASGSVPFYGLDSTWTTLIAGNNRYIYAGMGDGGRNYYGLNVTSKTSPSLMWTVTGGSRGFERMGNTWSQPVVARVRHGGTVKTVLLVGGGYDAAYEDNTYMTPATGTELGNAIYMIDALTGALIWSASASNATTTVADMRFSVPGRLVAVDKDADGLADHIYFNDLGGQIFRVDLNNSATATSLAVRVKRIAELGITEDRALENSRRFFEPPGVAYMTEVVGGNERIFAAVTAGSGYRSRPLDREAQERLYMIKDYDAARFDIHAPVANEATLGLADTVTTDDLADLTTALTEATAAAALVDKKGWYINLGSGEKVLSASFIYQRQVFFNTYTPTRSDGMENCAPVAGATSAWRVHLDNAMPAVRRADGTLDRVQRDVASGIAGDTLLIIGEGGVPGAITGATGNPPPPALPDDFNRILKTKWYEVRD